MAAMHNRYTVRRTLRIRLSVANHPVENDSQLEAVCAYGSENGYPSSTAATAVQKASKTGRSCRSEGGNLPVLGGWPGYGGFFLGLYRMECWQTLRANCAVSVRAVLFLFFFQAAINIV